MATSMAAAIAASIPAAQTGPTVVAPTYEAIPPSMSKLIDIEAEIPLTNVQLDGLVVTKIIKHSHGHPETTTTGLLIGIDLDGTLQITNSFPLPHANDDDDKTNRSLLRYQASMLRSLKEVQADDSIIGFYQSTTLGAFFSHSLIDLQLIHQERLRHGGIVVVHDVTQAARGNASFRAFKLSQNFLQAHKRGRYNTDSLKENRLTFSTILNEIPLKVWVNPLLGAFVNTLTQHSPGSPALLEPAYANLNLTPVGLSRNLESILEAVDDYKTEESNLAYLSRQIVREKSRAEAHVAKRKEENTLRVAQGLPPLPEDDVSRLFKIPQEPNRLESILLLGQIDAYAKSLAEMSSAGLVKMYAATAASSTTTEK